MQIRHASGDDWYGGPASKRRELKAAMAANGGSMSTGFLSGDGYRMGLSKDSGHSVGVIEHRPKAPTNLPDDRIGQVVDIGSWKGGSQPIEIEVSGNPELIPSSGQIRLGKKLEAEVLNRRVQPAKGLGAYAEPERVFLTVRCAICPPVGARIRRV